MLCPYCRTENRPGSTRCAACTSWMVTQPPVREWTRAREGTIIGGVARGLASRFAVPVAAVRLAFVLATIFGLWGLAIYLVLWIILPLEPLPLPPAWAPPPAPAQSAPPGQA